jgi:hypothetical protein
MADIHNALTRGSFSNALKSLLGATKDPGGIERYGETLTPVIDLWRRPEASFLRQEYLFTLHLALGAVAGELNAIAVCCPNQTQGQSMLVVVTGIVGAAGIAAVGQGFTVNQALRSTIAGTLASGGFCPAADARLQPNPAVVQGATPAEAFSGSDPATIGVIIDRVAFSAAEALVVRSANVAPQILTPGRGIVVQGDVANQSLRATFTGYVWVAKRGEL